MMSTISNRVRRRQDGAAAIELALVLPIFIVLLTFPLFYGRYFWHYTVAHKAAHDATRYLSTISVKEMTTPALAVAAEAIAKGIASEVVADLSPGGSGPTVAVFCGVNELCTGTQGNPLPQTVTVSVNLSMTDNLVGMVPTGPWGLPIAAKVEMRYVGK